MPQPKPYISRLANPVHGGTGYSPSVNGKSILDFSTCCNPYRPPHAIFRAVATCDFSRYPDPESTQFVGKLCRKLDTDNEHVIAGNGSTELLRMAALAFFGPGNTVVIPAPTYSEYELACGVVNASIAKYKLHESDSFRLDVKEFIKFARSYSPAGIFICNPNNPTGQYLAREDTLNIITAFPEALIVLDEAYLAFTANPWHSLNLIQYGNVLIIRSMTKDWALAGLRLGYGISSPAIINALKKVRPSWNVSTPAQQAGIAALECGEYIKRSRKQIEKCKCYIMKAFSELGYRIVDTQTNFFLIKTADAARFRKELLKKGVLVRDCSSFGLPEYVRIAPRNMADCRRLVKYVKEITEKRP